MSVPTTWYFTLVRFCSSSVRCAFLELAVGLRRVSIFMFVYIYVYIIEGSLEVKLPTIWTDGKSRGGKSQRREEQKREDQRRERVRRKKMQVREKGAKSRNTVFFQWFVAKAAGAEPSGQMRDEKLHAVVARSTFASEKAKDTPRSEHFWKLRCRKGARCCGAKHIWKSTCTKHTMFGPLFEVDVKKVRAVVARSTFPSQNAQNTSVSEHFWKLRCRKHISKSKVQEKTDGYGARSDVISCGRRKGLRTLSKVSKTWGFCSSFSYNHHYTTLHSTTL